MRFKHVCGGGVNGNNIHLDETSEHFLFTLIYYPNPTAGATIFLPPVGVNPNKEEPTSRATTFLLVGLSKCIFSAGSAPLEPKEIWAFVVHKCSLTPPVGVPLYLSLIAFLTLTRHKFHNAVP